MPTGDALVVGLLIAVNALYVAAEFAAVAVQKSQLLPLAKSGSKRAEGLLALQENRVELDRYIAACQIGITLSSLVVGAYGQARIAPGLGVWLEQELGWSAVSAGSAAITLVLLVLTLSQVVLGELVPKSLALQFPERTALATYVPTRWSVSLYRGFIWLLNGSGLVLLRPFGVKPGGTQHVHSLAEIRILLAESHKAGSLTPAAHKRLERGLQLSNRTVRQMMTPRNEIYALEVSTPADEALRKLLESPYSRVLIYRESLDQVLGAVNTKDVVSWFAVRGELPPLERMLRKMPFVPEYLRAPRLVRFLQEKQSSKAIVVDEFGGVQGIISIEDVLGQLFGDIGDELKQPEPGVERLEDGRVRLPGSLTLDEAEPWIGARWEGSSATVGGHILAHLGRWPTEGETLEIDGVDVTVTEMSPTAVRWVVARPRHGASEPGSSEEAEGAEHPEAPPLEASAAQARSSEGARTREED
ncbi:MAG: HlyC/CorC family transporter [Myxococcales bacterium]|nr:HlyC/CorC family transporter [Myxococcales bacterium]